MGFHCSAATLTKKETRPEFFIKLNVFNIKDHPLVLDYFLSTLRVVEYSSFYEM